jgi:hypothetical protein
MPIISYSLKRGYNKMKTTLSWWQSWSIRIRHWEYWPFAWVYGPIGIFWLWECLRCRSFYFFSNTNPTIYSGGFMMERKYDINALLPAGSFPCTLRFQPQVDRQEMEQQIAAAALFFPLIAKPDIGGKGRGVRKVETMEELVAYAQLTQLDFLVQALIPYPEEAGIFFCKMPGASEGVITGIVRKEFIRVKGDGSSTIRDLILAEPRYALQLSALATMLGPRMDLVLPAGESAELMSFGNHARGAKFMDDSAQASRLQPWMNALAAQIPGFHYGRLDIRFQDYPSLADGKHFSIIELNGSGSEPTHIYDPAHSIFFAWKEIIRHWRWMGKIARAQKAKGIPYMTRSMGKALFRDNAAFEKKLEALYV